jgi:hypothetical protein
MFMKKKIYKPTLTSQSNGKSTPPNKAFSETANLLRRKILNLADRYHEFGTVLLKIKEIHTIDQMQSRRSPRGTPFIIPIPALRPGPVGSPF